MHEIFRNVIRPWKCESRLDTMNRRILFVSHTADSIGPTNSLLLLLKHLHGTYQVAVASPGYGPVARALEREHIPFFGLPSLTKTSIPGLVRLIRREHIDLLYGNNTGGGSRNALLAAKLAGVPAICHARGMGWGKSWRHLGFLRLADATIAVSEACARSISRFVSPGRLHVVHNGVDTNGLSDDRSEARARLLAEIGSSPGDVIVTSVSHISPRKGQESAIRAMAKIIPKAPNVRLLLVGSLDRDAAYVDKIRSMIREAHLENHVFMLGFRSDVDQLMRGSDVLLHTAVADPHPRAVLEAMAERLPVVAFSTDGVAETVEPGHTGYLAPQGDVAALAESVLSLRADPALRKRLGLNARARVHRCFSAESTARRIGEIIDVVLRHRRQVS